MVSYDFIINENARTGNPIVTIQAHYWVDEWRQWNIVGKTALKLERDLILAELNFKTRDELWDEWDRILVAYDKGD